jgi:glycosyltransferase involved in cell wall biosynthesis
MSISYGLLSTHPPTRCGLATFNASLAAALAPGARYGIVRRTSAGEDRRAGPEVVHTWADPDRDGWSGAADALNAYDVALVQHEYGIYPGRDGDHVVPLLHRLTVPRIVVLHTVLSNPTAHQRSLLAEVVTLADAVVTMTETARDRLLIGYGADPRKVSVIPHGAPGQLVRPPRAAGSHLLTWGLIGPGKGIEWVLRALARLRDIRPAARYTVAGGTHPKVLERDGESYRTELIRIGTTLGVAASVDYQVAYRDAAALAALIDSADVVVLPYDSREQVTSGVLTEAVAAGVPVVATAFPHAVELLTDGPGLLVPHHDARALAAAIRRVLTEPGLSGTLVGRARALTGAIRWPAVAARYAALATDLVEARTAAGHRMLR